LSEIVNLESLEKGFNFKFDLLTSYQLALHINTVAIVVNFTNNLQQPIHPGITMLLEDNALSSFLQDPTNKGDNKSAVLIIMEADKE
jgi:hypothetical protein